jgi:hypothetical protein
MTGKTKQSKYCVENQHSLISSPNSRVDRLFTICLITDHYLEDHHNE